MCFLNAVNTEHLPVVLPMHHADGTDEERKKQRADKEACTNVVLLHGHACRARLLDSVTCLV